jgi:two-component SAPR family response regulator
MLKTIVLIENNQHELDLMKHAIEEIDSSLHCLSFVYADEVIPALTDDLESFPHYIFLDVDLPRKNVSDLLSELCPMKVNHACKIVVFAPMMPKRIAYAYRVMGANYAFQKPVTREGYREIFSRILNKENYTTPSTQTTHA